MSEERLKIAVFIDFDNIEIGVKKTLTRHFDVGTVLEAIKERGEVVTKIAYGDWKHASEYSRAMTQHAVQMVQRNLTPGGDKNGADINLALDALEMAFTRGHINAFVIVGGDSDFIALVEKLKLYDKTVFVVGGRSFTSTILQKNCHEFISYENLIGLQPAARRSTGRAPVESTLELKDALAPLRRALEVLSDREVSPQMGLLKSTLLQLDSTFSERDYGAHSFREFIQKMANAGYVRIKQVDRSLMVELVEQEAAPPPPEPQREAPAPAPPAPKEPSFTPEQAAEAVRTMRELFERAPERPHWPMYLRTFKQHLRSADSSFDERRFGFTSLHDLVKLGQKEGLLRIERNRRGLRIYPGEQFPEAASSAPAEEPAAVTGDAPQATAGEMKAPAEAPTASSVIDTAFEAVEAQADAAAVRAARQAAAALEAAAAPEKNAAPEADFGETAEAEPAHPEPESQGAAASAAASEPASGPEDEPAREGAATLKEASVPEDAAIPEASAAQAVPAGGEKKKEEKKEEEKRKRRRRTTSARSTSRSSTRSASKSSTGTTKRKKASTARKTGTRKKSVASDKPAVPEETPAPKESAASE